MNKRLVEHVAKTYARARTKTSPVLWRLFYWRPWVGKERVCKAEAVHQKFLLSPIDDAEKLLVAYPYRWEYLRGGIDASILVNKAHRFFIETKRGRDCDDIARMWTVWGVYNGYNAREWIHDLRASVQERARDHHVVAPWPALVHG